MEFASLEVLQNRLDNCPSRKTVPSQTATGKDEGLDGLSQSSLAKLTELNALCWEGQINNPHSRLLKEYVNLTWLKKYTPNNSPKSKRCYRTTEEEQT